MIEIKCYLKIIKFNILLIKINLKSTINNY